MMGTKTHSGLRFLVAQEFMFLGWGGGGGVATCIKKRTPKLLGFLYRAVYRTYIPKP